MKTDIKAAKKNDGLQLYRKISMYDHCLFMSSTANVPSEHFSTIGEDSATMSTVLVNKIAGFYLIII